MNRLTSPPLAWSDEFLLGYGPMDSCHEEFVGLVEALRRAGDDAVPAAFDRLFAHTRVHFGDEDSLMRETAFPSVECHCDEHAAVLRSFEGVQERVVSGDFEAARSLAQALADWFPGHADYLDSALAAWVCKLRLGGKPVVLRRRGAPQPTSSPI
jgi:hemerythrin